MAQEGSVAPKERVNIVYKPATGDQKEEVELPLKVLVMGSFAAEDENTPIEDRKPLNIDKDNFNDVLKAQKLSLDLKVKNKLVSEEDAQLSVNLNFQNLKDFAPDAIVGKVPELQKLIEMRDALKALKGPLGNIPEFRKKIQELVTDDASRKKLQDEIGIGQGPGDAGGDSEGEKGEE